MTAAERYPLWCLDNGDWTDETRYAGPFNTEAEAIEARAQYGGGTVRRCRRVNASEIDGREYSFNSMVEMLDEHALGGDLPSVLPEVWGRWDEQMVHKCEGAAEAFREFIDKWLRVDAYVCEGDEP
jgi:hypothetical protein